MPDQFPNFTQQIFYDDSIQPVQESGHKNLLKLSKMKENG